MKSKKTLIIIIITLILLVVLSVGVLAALYFTTDIFKSNTELFWKYFLQNEKISSIISNKNYLEQEQLKNQSSYTSDGQLIISSQSGESNAQEINCITSSRHDKNTERTYTDVSLVKDNNNILKASYINSGDVYSIMCDAIYPYYVGFRNNNLKELAKNWGVPEEQIANIPDSIDFSAINNGLGLTDTEKQHISNTYSNVILQSITDESYQKLQKETITVNNTNYEANKYQLTLSGETLTQIVISCLATLQSDTDTINYIAAGLSPQDQEEYKNSIIEGIDDIISNLQEKPVEESLIITVYVQKDKTIKTQVEITDVALLTIDLTENSANLLFESYENSEFNENSPMQITFAKSEGQGILNTVTILPDINKPEQSILLSISLGNIQNNNNMSNSYSLTVNENDSITEITYNTQTTIVAEVEEIMELLNSNSVIINNYSLEQLTAFFESLSSKAGEVLASTIMTLTSPSNEPDNQSITPNIQ